MIGDDLNWNRSVEKVKVKKYDEPIYVDKCCADAVKKIDALPDTMTVWCCCNHKGTVGGVEFVTKHAPDKVAKMLNEDMNKITRITFQDEGEYKGYNFEIGCQCSTEDQKLAKKLGKVIDDE